MFRNENDKNKKKKKNKKKQIINDLCVETVNRGNKNGLPTFLHNAISFTLQNTDTENYYGLFISRRICVYQQRLRMASLHYIEITVITLHRKYNEPKRGQSFPFDVKYLYESPNDAPAKRNKNCDLDMLELFFLSIFCVDNKIKPTTVAPHRRAKKKTTETEQTVRTHMPLVTAAAAAAAGGYSITISEQNMVNER